MHGMEDKPDGDPSGSRVIRGQTPRLGFRSARAKPPSRKGLLLRRRPSGFAARKTLTKTCSRLT